MLTGFWSKAEYKCRITREFFTVVQSHALLLSSGPIDAQVTTIRHFWIHFILLVLIVVQPFHSHAQSLRAEMTRVGDATRLEVAGAQSWEYRLARNGPEVRVSLSELDDKTKAHLSSWSDSLVKTVDLEVGADGGTDVIFKVSDRVEHFDYLTDQPTRLVVDFFRSVEKKPKERMVKKSPPKAKVGLAKNLPPKRLPASGKIASESDSSNSISKNPTTLDLPSAEKSKTSGVYDAADPDYKRFSILDADVKEEAIIASQKNVYLLFPVREVKTTVRKDILSAPPIYDIRAEDTDENKKARLLLTLFNKNRLAVYLKTLDFFKKQYPTSQYEELLGYMEADIYYRFYEETKTAADLERAVKKYLAVLNKFPTSLLSERTWLFIAYSYFDRRDYLNSLKIMFMFKSLHPKSKFIHQVQLSMADAYLGTYQPEAALKALEEVESNPDSGDDGVTAAFKKGDVYYVNKEYQKASEEYKKYLTKFPTKSQDYPNAYYNLAESLFWLKEYKLSLMTHRQFIKLFPKDEFGAYSFTRMGEILEILGATKRQVEGAYLEALFRFQGSEGSQVARIRLNSGRMEFMKEKELKTAKEEAHAFTSTTKIPKAREFVTILEAEGYNRRNEYNTALDLLVKFHKDNPESELDIFRERIRENIIRQLRMQIQAKKFLEVFEIYGKYASNWLKNNDRIDIEYYLGISFERAGLQKEAADYYRKVINRLYAIQGSTEEKERRVLEDLPSSESVNLRLAAINIGLKDFGKAAFHLDAIKGVDQLKPEDQIERIELSSVVYEEKGEIELAKKFLKDLIESWKGQPNLVSGPYLRLAELQAKTSEPEAALLNLKKILVLDSDSKEVSTTVVVRAMELSADILKRQQKSSDAAMAYRALLERFEGNLPLDSVRYKLGALQFELGQLAESEKTWSALKGDTLWAKLAREQLENNKWTQQYKKYLGRIPAMANTK